MSSAEGQVQNLGYVATFPLLLNIADEPTYFMALKDASGLVKKYAMVNVQKYQWVAIGDTIQECEKSYSELLNTNGIISRNADQIKTVSGTVEAIAPIVLEGTTHYYICLEGVEDLFDVDMSNEDLIEVIRYQPREDHIGVYGMVWPSQCQRNRRAKAGLICEQTDGIQRLPVRD